MKVSKRGKYLAVRLPAAIVRALDLKQGDEIDVHIVGARQLHISRSNSTSSFLAINPEAERK
jgi:antitoxin MazE